MKSCPDSIKFSSVQTEKEKCTCKSLHIMCLHTHTHTDVRTVDTCIVVYGTVRTYHEFTGRQYDLVKSK
jgi:hypothetical protein